MNTSVIFDALENCDLFKGLSGDDIEKIATLARIENYKAGELMFSQGDFGETLYIIIEGHIFLERTLSLHVRKGTAIIGILGKGRTFGCWSTLLGQPHSLMASALCKTPSTVITIQGPALRELMLGDFQLGFKILEKLCCICRDRIQGIYGALEKI